MLPAWALPPNRTKQPRPPARATERQRPAPPDNPQPHAKFSGERDRPGEKAKLSQLRTATYSLVMDQRHALGDLLKRLRGQAGLSQEELASAVGVNVHTIGDLERFRTIYPRGRTAYRIADALGLTGTERENWLSLALPSAGVAVTY
jgi:DNA-binding XRE family transcriptional regulator